MLMTDERESAALPPAPPRGTRETRPSGYRIRVDLDDALREYQTQTGAKRFEILDHALEEYFSRRGLWPKK